jgi:hypothetical protein
MRGVRVKGLNGVRQFFGFFGAALVLFSMNCWGQDSGATAHLLPVTEEWVEISPPVNHAYLPLINYGFHSMDGAKRDAPLTLYVGTSGYGIWKTTDGASTWLHISTGRNGERLGNGTSGSSRNWALAVDPKDSNVLYTVDGYGSSQGLWKSTNGGVDWDSILSPALMRATTNDINSIAIDPLDHLHLLVTGHSPWSGYADSGIIESFDGGATWKLHPPLHGWGTGPVAAFLGRDDDVHPSNSFWLLASQFGGIWRTADGGNSWSHVSDYNRSHAGFGLYRANTGVLYMGVNNRLARSENNGVTWVDAKAPTSPDAYSGIVGDGTLLWAMPSNTGVGTSGTYQWLISSESDGTHWKPYNSQKFNNGPLTILYDPIHRRLYAVQWSIGVWMLQR